MWVEGIILWKFFLEFFKLYYNFEIYKVGFGYKGIVFKGIV